MRALYLYPTLKMAGGISSSPPVLSFLAPATLMKSSRRQFLTKAKKHYAKHPQLRPYSAIPKPPRAPEVRKTAIANASSKPEALSPEELGTGLTKPLGHIS